MAKKKNITTGGIGETRFFENFEIANGLTYINTISKNHDMQNSHTLFLNPLASNLKLQAIYGKNIYGGMYLSEEVNSELKNGTNVVAAFNGDFFHPSTFVPYGLLIKDFKLICAKNQENFSSVGVFEDGKAIIEKPLLELSYTKENGKTYLIDAINGVKEANDNKLILLTPDYGSKSYSYMSLAHVILTAETSIIKLDTTIKAKIKKIIRKAKDISFADNEMILLADNLNSLGNLSLNEEIVFSFSDKSNNKNWKNIKEAISGFDSLLIENGLINQVFNTEVSKGHHPRTSIGLKEDGTLIIHQIDGRQPGYSGGLTDYETAEYLLSLGCKTALKLDGGGSSTLMIRLPGYNEVKISNRPSERMERKNANGFVIVDNSEPSNILNRLHIYPSKLDILSGSVINLITKGSGINYHPVQIGDCIYTASGQIGTVSEKGVFKAKRATGQIFAKKNEIESEITVNVLEEIDELYLTPVSISLSPNEEFEIKIKAYYKGMLIVSSPESFAFRLDEGKLGTIKNGHFKAANKLGIKGKIIVSYKKVSASINVSIGEKPIVINDFEEGIIKEKGKWWVSTSQPLINAKLSINDDERYVKFGEKSLRMDFDLRSSTGIGAISLYKVLDPENPNLSEPIIPKGNPTAIGMWVFGNFAQGAWIRCQYFVGSAIHYGEFGVVNWKGWKYVETKIYNPESLEIRIQFPIRIIALENYQRISGTLFFDRYRLIYGFIDDDTSLPTITNFTPSENSVINDFYPAISADLIDKDSGIDKNMTTLWFDKKKVEILTFQDIKNGVRLNYMPNFYQKITPGTHRAKIKAFDGFGNFTVKEWIFTVFSNTAKVYGVCTKKEKVYAGEFDQYQIFAESFENISGYNFKAQYNPHSIKIEKIIYGVESLHIAKEIINPFNGTIEIEIVEMNNIIKDDDKPFVEIIYSYLSDAIGEAYIKILESTITDNRNNNKINAVLPEFHMFVNNKYYLKFIGSTAQSLTEFYVATDGSVVEGAEIEVIYPIGITIEGITDAKGLLKTDVIGKLPVGILVRVRAVKDNLYSNIINIPILDSLGKEIPSRVVLSVGEDPSESVSFSWETNIFSNSSIVRIKSKETGLKEYNSDGRRRILVNTLFGRSETLMHALTVTDLIADTEYKYQIGNNDIWSEWKTFKTLKKEGKQAFLFYTDPQAFNEAGYKPLKNIYQEARNLNESISFAVASGDIVDNADNYDEWEYFDKVVGKDLGRMPHAMGIGNHEAVCNRNMFIGAFANPTNGIASLPKTNFFFKVGKALFLFIDTEAIDKFNEQKNWLKKTVRENNDSWKIVVMHRGPFPIYYESQAVRDFNSIFEELKIDLVLTGHDHIYNRTLHKGGIFKQKKGINYITGGSSGNKFYYKKPFSNVQQIIYAEKTPVFCIVEYDENELNYKAYTLAEKTKEIDAFTLRKNK